MNTLERIGAVFVQMRGKRLLYRGPIGKAARGVGLTHKELSFSQEMPAGLGPLPA